MSVAAERPRAIGGPERRRALFEEALSLIELSYDDDRLTVASLSERIFASRRQLQRAFAEAGTSVQERLHAVRMERSAELLHRSSLPVAEIARSVGYRQPAQFAKAFRRYYQLSPSQWRRSVNSNPTISEVIPMECKCGCSTSAPVEEVDLQPRPEREGGERDVDLRLEELDRRVKELETAA